MSIPTVPDGYVAKSPSPVSWDRQQQDVPEPVSREGKQDGDANSDAFATFTAHTSESSQITPTQPLSEPLVDQPSKTPTANSSPVVVPRPLDGVQELQDPRSSADEHDHLKLAGVMGGPGPAQSSASSQDNSTGSHESIPDIALNQPQALKEASAEPEAQDIGWNKNAEQISSPLVKGLANDDLWMFLRRFDMQMYSVRAISKPPPGGLDLVSSPEEDFAVDKLRSNVERIYMTVFIGLLCFAKHIARIRSWHEKRRTACFCLAYFAAWALNILVPTSLALVLALVVYPPSRAFLFPHAPLAAVDAKTGTLQTPPSGTLASESLTGAPEAHKGQAVEQEAANFVSSIASLAAGAAMGKKPVDPSNPDDDKEEKEGSIGTKVPDPIDAIAGAKDAREAAAGGEPDQDQTKQPMQKQIWLKARPVMRALAQVSDTWERLANALSPVPPFSNTARLKLGGALLPLFLVSLVLPAQLVIRAVTFTMGFAFFSQPWLDKGWHWLNTKYPHWMDMLDINNTLLFGIPTNAQLTLTLLRLAEAHNAPLPPAPLTSYVPPPDEGASRKFTDETPVDASHEEIMKHSVKAEAEPSPEKPKKKHGRKLVGLVKGITRAGVSAALGVDQVKAAAGSESALQKRGVLPRRGAPKPADGPSDFTGRLHGKKGKAFIVTTATTPCISFEYGSSLTGKTEPAFSMALNDIAEIRKVGGLGWKTRLLVGFALGMEVTDGLVIVDQHGQSYTITALPRRDELFNRLISLPDSYWEAF